MFTVVNAGKRSLFLDLKSDAGRSRLHALIESCDVVVEGFRPGVTTRLGCDYDQARRIRPSIVYCSLSGMGQQGPLATHPTHDLSLQAMVGNLRGSGPTDRIGVPWVDLATGTSAALAIVAAWHARTPAYLDMSMLDTARSWSAVKPAAVSEPEATYGVVAAADGAVVVALLEDAMWRRLCAALSWDDWLKDDTLATYSARRGHAARIRARLDEAFAARTLAEIIALAHEHDLPIGPTDVGDDPDVAEQLRVRNRAAGGPGAEFTPLPMPLVVPLEAAMPWPSD
jgi:crotonobetainyl-CoA:carnitine CoA-transferase CaiB-like acyl-CoA transferase